MEKLFSKLDLNDYVKGFHSFLAREKPLFLEGDVGVHYRLIAELERYEGIKPLPLMMALDTPLAHLSKMGTLRLGEIYAFVQIANYIGYLKTILRENGLNEWVQKIIIPPEISDICAYFDEKGELKSSVDEQFALIAQHLKSDKEEMNSSL